MWFLTGFYALLFYFVTAIAVAGFIYKIVQYKNTPAPLKIPTTPAPTTRGGVVLRLLREVVLFESLFKGQKWTWLFGWLFHFSLLLILLRHLRYFTEPVWTWVALLQPLGMYAGFTMVLGLGALWGRRLLVERIRYISRTSDHLILLLLIGIGVSGLATKFVDHTDIVGLKQFTLGLLQFAPSALPADPMLLIHLLLVAILILLLPFSKLLHIPGLFFSPTRNQVDNPREHRHIAPWAAELEKEE
jgi:nitrate reductase gamma subunit